MRQFFVALYAAVFVCLGWNAGAAPFDVPDTGRTVTYTVASPTSNFDVPFALYGDCSDLQVSVAGVVQAYPSTWNCVSKSGTPLAAVARPVSDVQVQLAAPVSSATVTISGQWRPRLTAATGAGVTRTEFNRVLGATLSGQREIADYLKNFPPPSANAKIDLTLLGADPTGVVDAAPLINATAARLTNGGTLILEPGTYKIGSTLFFGNGTSSAASTINNVRLEGTVNPKNPTTFSGFNATSGGVTLLWSGGNAPVISFQGPMQEWGLSKLFIDCNRTAPYGLALTSAQYGHSDNVSIQGCTTAGVYSTAYLPFGSFTNTDAFRNRYDDFVVKVPDIDGAKGVWLTSSAGPTVVGGSTVAADTDYNVWNNLVTWNEPSTSTHLNYGLYLQGTDGNFFYHFKPAIFNNQSISLAFDYTLTTFWPEGNYFFGIEPGNPVNIGTPDANSRPNVFYAVVEGNGNIYPTNLQNTQNAMPAVFGKVVDLTGQTAAIALTTAISPPPWKTGMYRINYYMGVTTAGTGGNGSIQFQWNDGAVTQNWVSGTTPLNAQGFISGSVDAFLIAGTNIGYQTNLVGATGSPAYQVHIRIERLD